MKTRPVAIVGGGAWGTALAVHLGRAGASVRLWIREDDLVARMRDRRDNPVFLPGVPIPATVAPTSRLRDAVEGAGLVVFAVPTAFAREVYRHAASSLPTDAALSVAAKGIEPGTGALPTAVLESVLGDGRRTAALSGPSFAEEVARGHPTALVVASADLRLALEVQEFLSDQALRLYTNDDVTGVQLGGALKNVIAIAAGLVEGIGYGRNTLAALVTRGLAEMARLGTALGGRPETFSGLAGLGDLVLTCTSDLSRNRRLGLALGRGERLDDVLARTPHVAEGVVTARSASELAARTGVAMPITAEVYRILYEDGSPREAIERLMSRPLRPEAPA